MKALDLLHTRNSLTRKALREHTGREVKHLGDGIMASFASIDQSLECAIAIQRAFASYNIQNSGAPLHLRIGLSVARIDRLTTSAAVSIPVVILGGALRTFHESSLAIYISRQKRQK